MSKPISRDDVSSLADIACQLDELKNRLPDEPRLQIAENVIKLHDTAEALDVQCGFGIYATESIKAAA